jgi:flavin reductase (DIM6/NTAB) family NADH-FMN oxidoreductase RutF
MYINFSQLSASETYFTMTQTIIPRPISWILSKNAENILNLAPFSYFNAISSTPPLICLSINKKEDGSLKDTRANILQHKDFVIHLPHHENLEAVNNSAKNYPADISEIEALNLETVEFEGFSLPRLKDCRVAFACELSSEVPLEGSPNALIIGKVKALYIDDAITFTDEKGRFKVDTQAFQPLSRLGAGEYMKLGDIVTPSGRAI